VRREAHAGERVPFRHLQPRYHGVGGAQGDKGEIAKEEAEAEIKVLQTQLQIQGAETGRTEKRRIRGPAGEQDIGAAIRAPANSCPYRAGVPRNEPHVGHPISQAFQNWI
jgi:hypothetical protein